MNQKKKNMLLFVAFIWIGLIAFVDTNFAFASISISLMAISLELGNMNKKKGL